MTAGLFLSYSTRDRDQLDNLLSALRRADEGVWFDEQLGGGEVWWQQILEHIRGCEVFLFALSDNSLQSKPCLAELSYAQALGKPVLPIQIGPVESLRVTPLAAVEAIDFQTPTADSGIRLITAMQRARQRSEPLPSPLPEEPPVPFAYLMHLASTITGANLDPQHQADLLNDLRTAIDDSGDDSTTRRDITQLLHTLQGRSDLSGQTRTSVAELLACLDSSPSSITPTASHRSKKWLIAGAAALVSVAVAVVGILVTHERDSEPTASAILPPTEQLNSILLSAADVTAIMGATDMQAEPVADGMNVGPDQMSDPDCLGSDIVAAAPVYEGSGWSAVRKQTLSESAAADPDTMLFWVDQSVVSFPSSQKAAAFLATSAERWKGCSDRVIRETDDSGPISWTYGPSSKTGNMISQLSFQEGGEDWACQHALTAYGNSIMEAVACSRNIADQASRIVGTMVEKARA